MAVELPPQFLGSEVVGTAHGLSDGDGESTVRLLLECESMRAPSPVELQAHITVTGDLMLSWRGRTPYDLDAPSVIGSTELPRDHRYVVGVRGPQVSISLTVTSEAAEIPADLMQQFIGEQVIIEVADGSGVLPSRPTSLAMLW